MRTFPQMRRRQQSDAAEPATAFDILDEQYEVLDNGAFWDETAEVLAPTAAAS